MKLSVALTSRDANSGSANFIDDVRSFKMTHMLNVISDQHGKLGELKFTFFIGDKLSKLEHSISYLKEIDILEIEDKLISKYRDLEESRKPYYQLFLMDDNERVHVEFSDLVIERNKVEVKNKDNVSKDIKPCTISYHIINYGFESEEIPNDKCFPQLPITYNGYVRIVYKINDNIYIAASSINSAPLLDLRGLPLKQLFPDNVYSLLFEPFKLNRELKYYDVEAGYFMSNILPYVNQQ